MAMKLSCGTSLLALVSQEFSHLQLSPLVTISFEHSSFEHFPLSLVPVLSIPIYLILYAMLNLLF